MNTLSIFLYLANVIPNIGGLLVAIGVFSSIGVIGLILVRAMHNSMEDYTPSSKYYVNPLSYIKWIWVPIVAGLLAAVIPSERTMYMIAASELGEIAVMNEEVQEVFDALKERILVELRPAETNN